MLKIYLKHGIILLSLVLFLGSMAYGDSLDIDYVNSTLWKGPNDIAISGDYVYCTMEYGIQVLDISTPNTPIFVSQFELWEAKNIHIANNYAYVVTRDDSSGVADEYVYIVDISNPMNLEIVGTYHQPGCEILSVAVDGNYAYLATDNCGIVTINISNHSNPVFASVFDTTGEASDVAVFGGLCYAIFDGFGMVVLEDSGSTALGVYESDWINKIELTTDYACIYSTSYWVGQIEIVDISTPSLPSGRGSINMYMGMPGAPISDVEIFSTYVYVGYGYTMKIVDISDPMNPDSLGSLLATTIIRNIDLKNEWIFQIVSRGIDVIDVSNPSLPNLSGIYDFTGGSLNTVVVDGNYAFIGCNQFGNSPQSSVDVVDISNPSMPEVVFSLDSICGNDINDMIVIDTLLYMATGSSCGLIITNISDPMSMFIEGSYSNGEGAMSLTIRENVAYITFNYFGLISIDITDPTSPTPLDTILTGWNEDLEDVTIEGNYVYMARDSGLAIVDVSDPGNMFFVQPFDDNFYYDVIAENGYLYAGAGDSLYVFNISTDPENPSLVGSCELVGGGQKNMKLRNDYLFIAQGYGLTVVDISNPSTPHLVGSYDGVNNMYDVDYKDWYIFAVEETGGFLVLSMTDPTDMVEDIHNSNLPEHYLLSQNYPNPFNPTTTIEFSIPTKSHVELTVYDILGRQIETVIDQSMKMGNYKYEWNGDRRASGVYFYRLETADYIETRKMVLLK